MKTIDGIIKVIAGLMFVNISLVLFGTNGYAQNYFDQDFNESLNPIACAIIEDINSKLNRVDVDKTNKNKVEFYAEILTEKELKLETWMLDEKVFDLKISTVDVEAPLDLEDWMINENYFLAGTVDVWLENEEALKLENWMIEKEIWE